MAPSSTKRRAMPVMPIRLAVVDCAHLAPCMTRTLATDRTLPQTSNGPAQQVARHGALPAESPLDVTASAGSREVASRSGLRPMPGPCTPANSSRTRTGRCARLAADLFPAPGFQATLPEDDRPVHASASSCRQRTRRRACSARCRRCAPPIRMPRSSWSTMAPRTTRPGSQRAWGASVLSSPYSMGNGAAIKRGARVARGDVLVFMDADGQHERRAHPRAACQAGAGL
jgi:hypothetical protein